MGTGTGPEDAGLSVVVRLGSQADTGLLKSIERACFSKEVCFEDADFIGFDEDKEAGLLSDYSFIIAEVDGKAVGYAVVAACTPAYAITDEAVPHVQKVIPLDSSITVIDNLVVLPDFRKLGIASMLVERCFDFAKAHKTKQVFALGWSKGGFPMLAKKFGFSHIHTLTGHYQDHSDALVFLKKV